MSASAISASPSTVFSNTVGTDLFRTFLRSLVRSVNPEAGRPRIHSKSRHYDFAVYVCAGFSCEDACRELNIKERTAEAWRRDLRREAAQFFGRPVSYEFAARYCLDDEMRRLFEAEINRSDRDNPV